MKKCCSVFIFSLQLDTIPCEFYSLSVSFLVLLLPLPPLHHHPHTSNNYATFRCTFNLYYLLKVFPRCHYSSSIAPVRCLSSSSKAAKVSPMLLLSLPLEHVLSPLLLRHLTHTNTCLRLSRNK